MARAMTIGTTLRSLGRKGHPIPYQWYIWLRVYLLLLLMGITTSTAAQQTGSHPLEVFVSIFPQAYFVERIGGSSVTVEVLVGPGKSHHTYEPTPRQLTELTQADVYFRIGVPFEKALATKIAFTMDRLRMVETQKEVPLRYLPESQGKGTPDPHIWMDPKLVKIQAASISETLSQIDPVHAVDYNLRLKAFQDDLDRIDQEIAEILAPLKGKKVYVFHPAYGYFLETYGLVQAAVEVEGKEPGPRHLAEMVDRMKQEQVKVLFVQPQFSAKTAKTIATEVGASVITIDPLARDYLENLRQTALKIKEAFGG